MIIWLKIEEWVLYWLYRHVFVIDDSTYWWSKRKIGTKIIENAYAQIDLG